MVGGQKFVQYISKADSFFATFCKWTKFDGLQVTLKICNWDFKNTLCPINNVSFGTFCVRIGPLLELQWVFENLRIFYLSTVSGICFDTSSFNPAPKAKLYFQKLFLTKFVATYPSYKKYIKRFHHRYMVQNLEFQICIEKMLERPRSLFMQKRLYSTGLDIAFRTKCRK